jgi:uncharacterized protein YwgA
MERLAMANGRGRVAKRSTPGRTHSRLRLLQPARKETILRRDWLLLLLDSGLDPIRIQNAMFLFAQEAGAPAAEVYRFRPYNWGPFSQPIYGDLEYLVGRGLVERIPEPGTTYATYKRTAKGNAVAQQQREHADTELVAAIDEVKATVARLSFDELLQYVYSKYPDYAVNSVYEH